MTRRKRALSLCCTVALFLGLGLVESADRLAWAQDGPETSSEEALKASHVPPRKRKKLREWLAAGLYRSEFLPEPAVHRSLGPHGGNVRTYYNPILVEDLRAGRTEWSQGAAMVKELYLTGTEEVRGYAVMYKVKKETGSRGEGWLFYETFDASAGGGFYGRGLGLCVNCHRAGTDLLLSEFRP